MSIRATPDAPGTMGPAPDTGAPGVDLERVAARQRYLSDWLRVLVVPPGTSTEQLRLLVVRDLPLLLEEHRRLRAALEPWADYHYVDVGVESICLGCRAAEPCSGPTEHAPDCATVEARRALGLSLDETAYWEGFCERQPPVPQREGARG